MPTQAKIDKVSELQEKLEKCSIAVTTRFSNISVNEMTDLRRRTREAGFEFLVIKNSLMSLAADAAKIPQLKDIMQGPTAIAFGYDEPVDVAKTLHEYIRTTRSTLVIQGAVMGGGPAMPTRDVERLATLPPRPQLVAQLLGQLQAPIYRLLNVLNGPLWSFGGLLQARIHQLETEASAATVETALAEEPAETEPMAEVEAPADEATPTEEPEVAEAATAEAGTSEQPEAAVEAEAQASEETAVEDAEATAGAEPEAAAEEDQPTAEAEPVEEEKE